MGCRIELDATKDGALVTVFDELTEPRSGQPPLISKLVTFDDPVDANQNSFELRLRAAVTELKISGAEKMIRNAKYEKILNQVKSEVEP